MVTAPTGPVIQFDHDRDLVADRSVALQVEIERVLPHSYDHA